MSIRKYRGSVINLIEVNHLVKQYGAFRAVNDLSFTVEPGQIYGFLGPNGAGKSTTMNIMTGYLSATSGTVRIAGHEMLLEPEEAKRHIGYLPEIPPVLSLLHRTHRGKAKPFIIGVQFCIVLSTV